MSDDNVAYLKEQGVEQALVAAVAELLRQTPRPANALSAIANIIAAKAGAPALPPPTTDYLSTVGNTPMVQLKKMLPEGCKAKAVYVKLEMQNPGGSISECD
jgi:hypothetical protein